MKNELQQHKKADTVKWSLTLIAFILVGVMLVGLILQVFGMGKMKPSEWFNKQEQTEQSFDDKGEVTDANGNTLKTDGTVQAMPEKMIFRSNVRSLSATSAVEPQAAALSVTLVVTIKPYDADNQGITWSVRFKNASSTWASGKTVTDYMTVTATSGNSKSATATCKKGFSEQIEIVAASDDNPEIKAVCTCDYVKLLTGITVSGTEDKIAVASGKSGSGVKVTPVWSDGTIDSEIITGWSTYDTNMNMEICFSEAVQTEFNKLCSYNASSFTDYRQYYVGQEHGGYNMAMYSATFLNDFVSRDSAFIGAPDDVMGEVTSALRNAIRNVSSNHVRVKAYAINVYNGEKIGNKITGEGYITLDVSNVKISVTSVNFDTGNNTWVIAP